MARSKIFVLLTLATLAACQSIVGLDKFQKSQCDFDCGTDSSAMDVVAIDATDAGFDVVFGDASVANRWATWRMPNPADAETDANNVTYSPGPMSDAGPLVHDNVSNLSWTKNDLGALTYFDAIKACESAGLRLPTRIELYSLVDYTKKNNKTYDESTFNGTGSVYWTQSPALPSMTSVWGVNFTNASLVTIDLTLGEKNFARCVQ